MYFEKVDYFAMIVVEVVRLNNRELFRKKNNKNILGCC